MLRHSKFVNFNATGRKGSTEQKKEPVAQRSNRETTSSTFRYTQEQPESAPAPVPAALENFFSNNVSPNSRAILESTRLCDESYAPPPSLDELFGLSGSSGSFSHSYQSETGRQSNHSEWQDSTSWYEEEIPHFHNQTQQDCPNSTVGTELHADDSIEEAHRVEQPEMLLPVIHESTRIKTALVPFRPPCTKLMPLNMHNPLRPKLLKRMTSQAVKPNSVSNTTKNRNEPRIAGKADSLEEIFREMVREQNSLHRW